jgi:hypothetical protein
LALTFSSFKPIKQKLIISNHVLDSITEVYGTSFKTTQFSLLSEMNNNPWVNPCKFLPLQTHLKECINIQLGSMLLHTTNDNEMIKKMN